MKTTNTPKQNGSNKTGLLWTATATLAFSLLFARAVWPELLWLTLALALGLIAVLVLLIQKNRTSLRSRSAAYGLNSFVTVLLVLSILGVLNFLAARHPGKLDLTKNKLHTLSDQTEKVIKGLQSPVKAVYFSKVQQREQIRPLLDNLKSLNPKFEIEYVDPDKEPSRVKQAGIRTYGVLQLLVGTRDVKIENATEEKITNALIKLLKDKAITLCNITGHGEKDYNSSQADGYDAVKKALTNQSYEIKDVSLIQEGKIPDTCHAISILGPTKAFFEAETKLIREWLSGGGRALIALDVNIRGGDASPEIAGLLQSWYIKPENALIIDPISRMLQLEPTVPIVATYSKDNPITKEFQGNCIFPLVRPLELIPGAPTGLNVQWLAQTTPNAWGETSFDSLGKGQVSFNGPDFKGPLKTAFAVEGKQKDSKATRNTRMVVFGSSNFAANQFSRFGNNLDFYLNAVSWLVEDESLISIRAKEDTAGKIELSQKQGTAIFLITVILIPVLISISGIVVWAIRRKL